MMENIVIKAAGRQYVFSVHEDMLNDLPPAMQVVYSDWLMSFTRGRFGEQEASIRLAMLFTNAGRGSRLDPARWMTYGFSAEELGEFVSAGVRIMDALYPAEAPDEEAADAEAVVEGDSGND
jgi:hypothetical protein